MFSAVIVGFEYRINKCSSHEEAIRSSESKRLKKAMDEEMESLKSNETS